jgi:hypothetical protein
VNGTTLEFDHETLTYRAVTEIRAAIDAHFVGLLREAYEAGYRAGEDQAMWDERGWGKRGSVPATFEDFLAALIAERAS